MVMENRIFHILKWLLDVLPTMEVSIQETTEIILENKLFATSSHAGQKADILIISQV